VNSWILKFILLQLLLPPTAFTVALANSAPPTTSLLTGFVDDRGKTVGAQSLKKPIELVVFGYVSCPDACPVTLLAIHEALQTLGKSATDVDPAFITVDPDRDTVPVLHRYVEAFDRRIRGYRGTNTALTRIAHSLDVKYQRRAMNVAAGGYSMDHTATIFILQRDGRVAAQVPHVDDPKELTAAIVTAVSVTLACLHADSTTPSLCLPSELKAQRAAM
jgi:cytochrome oxidase Cu insertion factor (SCO1/SenC/PrrC family)